MSACGREVSCIVGRELLVSYFVWGSVTCVMLCLESVTFVMLCLESGAFVMLCLDSGTFFMLF